MLCNPKFHENATKLTQNKLQNHQTELIRMKKNECGWEEGIMDTCEREKSSLGVGSAGS